MVSIMPLKSLFFALLLPLLAVAQPIIRINGTLAGLPPTVERRALLEQFIGDIWQKADAAQMDETGYFQFPSKPRESGLYRIGFPREGHPVEFIIGPADSLYVFNSDFQAMIERKVKPLNNRESLAWELWKPVNEKYGYKKMMNVYGPGFDPVTYPQILREVADVSASIRSSFPGTYTASVLLAFLPQPAGGPVVRSSPAAYFAAYFLGNMPWQNPQAIRNRYFKEMLDGYTAMHTKAGLGSLALCDTLMPRAIGNDLAHNFVYKYLLSRSINTQDDAAARYLLNSYSPGCTDNGDPLDITQLIASMNRCAAGQVAPELTLPGMGGIFIPLSGYYTKHKLTLVLFWRTNCSHCVEHMPEIQALYTRYAAKGFGVYAASIDNNPDEWQKFVAEKQLPFANVIVPKNARTGLADMYPVISTPFMMLVNQQGVIVDPLVSPAELEAAVRKALE